MAWKSRPLSCSRLQRKVVKPVLIIDQLDAISTASGRNSDFFDAVEGLLNEARGLRDQINLHVIVVCRQFDWQNDHRLRRLLSSEHVKVEVGQFSADDVKAVLEAEGFRMNLFYPSQLALPSFAAKSFIIS